MQILIVSDIHANLSALEAVLSDAKPFDRIWCLGDVVGYGPEPNACIETLREHDLVCIAGNHDWGVRGELDLAEFTPDARRAAKWTRDQLTLSSRDWLQSLPKRIPPQAGIFTLIHGSPRDPIREYVLNPIVARINFSFFDTQICLMGHTHIPIVYRLHAGDSAAAVQTPRMGEPMTICTERFMLNPGSVGQPRDGDRRAAYALLDLDRRTITHHRVEYDISATQKKMERANLPARLIRRLTVGA